MRLFVAVPLPVILKATLVELIKDYAQHGVRFVPENNLHLTLHFIGNIADEAVNGITEILAQVASHNYAFRLTFQEVAPGPTLRSPRLIWARFQEHPAFAQLATDLCTSLDAAPGAHGKFIPHITLARINRDYRKTSVLPTVRDARVPDFPVTGFALWQSELQSPHPIYSVLQEFSLQEVPASML